MEDGGRNGEDADREPASEPQVRDANQTQRACSAREGGGMVLAYKSDGLRPLQVPTVPRRHLGSYVVEEVGPP
eukprot:9865357-Lingulodinium_polyedra.AAC.1